MDEVGPGTRYLVVYPPRARDLARAAGGRGLEREERDDVPRVRVEDLLVRRVGRAADDAALARPGQVLDVRQDHVGLLAVELVVLPRSLRRHVRRDAGVYNDVLLARVVVYSQPAQHEETVAVVQLCR